MTKKREAFWHQQHTQWRDPMQVISGWEAATTAERPLFKHETQGRWWEVLADCQVTLLVSREYEHLLLALSVDNDQPSMTYMKLPHPSGITFDPAGGVVYVACTRNPNQVLDFKPVTGVMARDDMPYEETLEDRPLVPTRARFLPGSLYIHDLAMIGGQLHANSVGQNAIIRLDDTGSAEKVWWSHSIEQQGEPYFAQNHLQLNSIAAGDELASSYFSASTDTISTRRPGHRNFPVNKRGVIFSGATREVFARGLTRPHSARLHHGRLWVDNSGYGEFGTIQDGGFHSLVRLPGWTRGLGFAQEIAFVGTSRVLPRFSQYAPGLDVSSSRTGIHAVNLQTGEVLGSIFWEYGNQIFAIEPIPQSFSRGFPFAAHQKRAVAREKKLFYSFQVEEEKQTHAK